MSREFKPGDRVRVKQGVFDGGWLDGQVGHVASVVHGHLYTIEGAAIPRGVAFHAHNLEPAPEAATLSKTETVRPAPDAAGGEDLRDLAKQITDEAWPEFGGNHQSAEWWHGFSDAVEFIVSRRIASLQERVSQAEREVSALIKSAAAKGGEPDLLLHEWREERELRQAAEARALAAEKALEPFAAVAEDLDDTQPDSDHLWESPAAMGLTAGNLRHAAAIAHQIRTRGAGRGEEAGEP